jgi:hypothetical protein
MGPVALSLGLSSKPSGNESSGSTSRMGRSRDSMLNPFVVEAITSVIDAISKTRCRITRANRQRTFAQYAHVTEPTRSPDRVPRMGSDSPASQST